MLYNGGMNNKSGIGQRMLCGFVIPTYFQCNDVVGVPAEAFCPMSIPYTPASLSEKAMESI